MRQKVTELKSPTLPRQAEAVCGDGLPPAAATGYSYLELGSTEPSQQTALATESPLAISFNGLNQAVMMVSPLDLEDYIVGFSFTSGIIQHPGEIYDLHLRELPARGWHADVEISSRAFWNLKRHRRQQAGSSGCGLCGVEALEQALPTLPPLTPSRLPPAEHLHQLRQRLHGAQRLAQHSGGLHAAAFIDRHDQMLVCREDIGRHNALDKLVGFLLRHRHDTCDGLAVVTSRCGLELLHKVVRAGIGTLVSLSAPTSLTVDWARRHNLNLIHAPHRDTPRVYSPGPDAEFGQTRS